MSVYFLIIDASRLCRFTTEKEIDMVFDMTVKEVNRLRELSPLWEMVQEGIDPSTVQWTQH
jgi:cysteine desulfurase